MHDSEDKIARETEFHNRRFSAEVDSVKERTSGFYAVARRSFDAYRNSVFSLADGRPLRALEYGCGDGGLAFDMAARGIEVVGIDVSPAAIERAESRKKEGNGARNLCFEVMDAEKLTFPENSFDFVYGSAILHHLDLEKAYQTVSRVLKPEGTAVFLEPLGHNPLINLYRCLTPNLRTSDEHPLLRRDLRLAGKFFRNIHCEYFNLFTLFALPFKSSPFFTVMLGLLERLEKKSSRLLPFMNILSWSVVIRLQK